MSKVLPHVSCLERGGHAGADDDRVVELCQIVRHRDGIGAVYQHQIQIVLLCDAHGGADVVRAVGVYVQGHLLVQHQQHILHAGILAEPAARGLCLLLVVAVLQRVLKALAQMERYAHAGGKAVLGGAGILTQTALHGGVAAQQHLIRHRAGETNGRANAADDAVAAGADQRAGHTGAHRIRHRPVKGIDGVQHLQFGGQRAGVIAAVVAHRAHALLADADVAVGVDHAGGHVAAGGIHALLPLHGLQAGGDGGDDTALHPDVPGHKAALLKQKDLSVLNQHKVLLSGA